MSVIQAKSSLSAAQIFQYLHHDISQVQSIIDSHLSSAGPALPVMESVLPLRGKMLRPMLLLLAGKAAGGCTPEHIQLAAVAEMVHQAAMVHDDVLDGATVRHSRPSVNSVWGNEAAVMLGDLLISSAFHLCSLTSKPVYSQLVGETATQLCRGELEQIASRGRWSLSEDEYLNIAELKTAALTSVCCRLGAIAAGACEEVVASLGGFGRYFGLAYQLIDDVLDFTGDVEMVGKSLGRDLAEGEVTFPLIHYLGGDSGRINEILAAAEDSQSTRQQLAERMQENGSIDYARCRAGAFLQQACQCLDLLKVSRAREYLRSAAKIVLSQIR